VRCERLLSSSDFVAVITDFIIPSIELAVEMDFIFDNRARLLICDRDVQTFPIFVIGCFCHTFSLSNFVTRGNFVYR
jgi:hypothetical protein